MVDFSFFFFFKKTKISSEEKCATTFSLFSSSSPFCPQQEGLMARREPQGWGGTGGHLNMFVLCCCCRIFSSLSLAPDGQSLHPVALIKLRLVLGVGVLDGDAARQDGGHVVAHALVLGLLLSLLLHFPQLDTWRGGGERGVKTQMDNSRWLNSPSTLCGNWIPATLLTSSICFQVFFFCSWIQWTEAAKACSYLTLNVPIENERHKQAAVATTVSL